MLRNTPLAKAMDAIQTLNTRRDRSFLTEESVCPYHVFPVFGNRHQLALDAATFESSKNRFLSSLRGLIPLEARRVGNLFAVRRSRGNGLSVERTSP